MVHRVCGYQHTLEQVKHRKGHMKFDIHLFDVSDRRSKAKEKLYKLVLCVVCVVSLEIQCDFVTDTV